jgi:penicillin amidase
MRRLVVPVIVLVAVLLLGARRLGPLPALGAFLEPAHGVWALARGSGTASDAAAEVSGLGDTVRVVYDDRAVPHVFAANELDAYRALGYVVARDRLFQLYLQTMAATGRLTEIAGAQALPLDREMRRLGLPRAAERKVAAAQADGPVMRIAAAYAEGVNAYVDAMPRAALPLEFRLLGVTPPRWRPIDSYHLLNRMGWTLASISLEHDRARAAALVGDSAAAALFPDATPIQEPIQPNGAHQARVDRRRLPPPGTPDSTALVTAQALEAFAPERLLADAARDDEPRSMASNNWAVSPRRTAAGHALLAGDPHLDLTLPSIWYEAHLVVPSTLDAYGVTIPGAPAIVIGFNRDVAWTFTNTGADVMDLYAEQVDDVRHPARYMLDGAWRPLERRVEAYRGRGGEVLATDTVYYTHRGPMRLARGRWLSMRWTVLEGGRELAGFADGMRARSAEEFQRVMSASYEAPAQNMLAADRGGHIAIRSTGRFPIRAGDGDGARIRDGRLSASDWRGALAVPDYPQAADPAQGYLASANQQPVDPATTRQWWGGSYDPWRAMRINTLLRADSSVTPDAMRRYQTDRGSARADLFAPYFVEAARRVLARREPGASDALANGAKVLAGWNRRYERGDRHAVVFEAAMRLLAARTWDELRGADGARVTPPSAVLAALLADSSSVWWDDRTTPALERRDDILASSLEDAFTESVRAHGAPDSEGWRWDHVQHAAAKHVLQLPALSALDLPPNGGPETLSPTAGSGVHGASWRMVVELGPQVRAWVTYPGGQSGDPASARYRDHLPTWTAGELEPARVPATARSLDAAQRSGSLLLSPARRPR